MEYLNTISEPIKLISGYNEPTEPGWRSFYHGEISLYSLAIIKRNYLEYGFDLYVQNLSNSEPKGEMENFVCKIFMKKAIL